MNDLSIFRNFLITLFTPIIEQSVNNAVKTYLTNFQSLQQESDIIFNAEEACLFVNLAKPTLYSLTSSNSIPFSKKGKKLYFKKSDLIEWVNSCRKKTREEINKEAENYINKRRTK